MEFNKKIFNRIVFFAVCLICFVFVFSTVDFSMIDNIDNTIADSIDIEDGVHFDEEDDTIEDNGSVELAPVFTAKTKWQALNYALANLSKYDYKIILNQSVVGGAMGISGSQTIDRVYYKQQKNYFSKAILRGAGANYTEYLFTDGKTSVITNKNNTNNITDSYASYVSKKGFSVDGIFYNINSATAVIDKFDYNHPINKTHYILKVTLKPGAYAEYLKRIEVDAGSGSNPQMTSITLTIKIDMKYGRITSIVAKEEYKINQLGVRANCDSTVNYSFKYGNYTNEADYMEIRSVLGR